MECVRSQRRNEPKELKRTAVRLRPILDTGRSELEALNAPLEVLGPIRAPQRHALTDGGLVDLDGKDAGLLEVDDFVAEGEGELTALDFARDVDPRERPNQDRHRPARASSDETQNELHNLVMMRDSPGKHALDGELGEGLGVRRPADGHGRRTRNVGDDDGRSDITRAVRLNPGVLSEDEAVELFAKVLNPVQAGDKKIVSALKL